MDVLISRLLELDVDRNSEGDCEVQLLEHLGEERCRSGKKLERAVRKHRGEARARLKRISDNIKSTTRTSDEEGTNKRRDTRVNAATSVLELASGLSDPNRLNRANLHSYRLKLKELRYLLKSAEGNPDQKFVDALGACKDAIGEWHDWEELVAIANEVLDHGRNCQLVERLKAAAQAKFDTALSVTNRMRSKFIRGRPSRTRRSPNRQRPPKQPGLETAGSLVSSGSRP